MPFSAQMNGAHRMFERCALLAGLSLSSALVVGACSSASPPELASEAPVGGGEDGPDGATSEGDSSALARDAAAVGSDGGQGADGRSGDVDARTDASPVDSRPDAGPPLDAPLIDRQSGETCNSKWWATSSAFDDSITPSSFASALNPIVGSSSIHPFTLAMQLGEDGGWTATVSGTATDGSGNQYFPGAHPATTTPMSVTPTSVVTAAPEASAWFHIYDAGGNELWIPIARVALSADYGDPGCGTLTGGRLTAVIPVSVSAMTIQPIGLSSTTMGALLGPATSSSPAGWNVEMAFDAASVQVY